MLNVENYSVVLTNTAIVVVTLKRATTVLTEMLDDFQHSVQLTTNATAGHLNPVMKT
jgi:hypothetical protein